MTRKTNRARILHIPNYYPPHIGGIEEVCYSIISCLPNYDNKVICFNDKKTTQIDQYENAEVIRCGVVKKLFSQSLSFSFYKELKRIFKEFKPDIVHFHAPNPLGGVYLLSVLPAETPLILHWHADITEQDFLYTFYRPIEKQLLKRSAKILVTSPTYVPGSKALLPWRDKLEIVPNTVNTEKLQKRKGDDEAIQKIKDMYEGKKIIFTFGRHVPYKGFKYLIEAAPLLSDDAVIVIAGQGPLSKDLKRQAAPFPSVHFIGRLSNDDLRQYLHAAYLFAFPSVTRNEAFGIALAEAMYCGLPAVTFTIPNSGVNWVSVDRETGLESENGNVQAFAGAINKILEDPSLRKKLGVNASLRARKYFVADAIKNSINVIWNDNI
jgi:glycosyltransferase involved in cell wall biosynthesis